MQIEVQCIQSQQRQKYPHTTQSNIQYWEKKQVQVLAQAQVQIQQVQAQQTNTADYTPAKLPEPSCCCCSFFKSLCNTKKAEKPNVISPADLKLTPAPQEVEKPAKLHWLQ